MADETKPDQKPATLEPPKDIEELLKELPKVEGPKPPLVPPPSKPLLPNPSPPPLSSPPPKPPPPSPNTQPPPSQSFKSSIRTMAEDLEAAKKGLKPESKPFEIKPPPPVPKAPVLTAPSAPRPPLAPQVRLGAPEKSKIIEAPKIIPPPPPPVIPPRPLLGLPPTAGRKLPISPKLLLLILGGAVVFIGAWYFLTRESEKIAVPTPTITPTPTPTPVFPALNQILNNRYPVIISSTDNFITSLNNLLKNAPLQMGGFTALDLVDENDNKYRLSEILQKLGIEVPEVLAGIDETEWTMAVYGQQEMFDQNGLLNFNQTPKMKIGLIAKSSSPELLRSNLNTWETAMASDLKDLLGLDLKKASSQTFLDNIYGGVNIRYRNFPFADSTIDYAIVDLPEFGLSYLVVTGSRETIYSAVNLLQSQ